MKPRKLLKPLGIVFFIVIALVTLAALFITEENLRGKWAWEKTKKDLEAKGENFDPNSLLPPPIPDDQNLAEIPLFVPIKSLLLTGSDPRPVKDLPFDKLADYAQINPKAQPNLASSSNTWLQGSPADLKTWQTSYRANFPALGLAGSPGQDIVKATDALAPAFAELRQAVKTRPLSRFDVQYQDGITTRLAHLAVLRSLVTTLTIRATAELRLNRPDDAFADLQLAFTMMNATRTEPFLITHLVRAAQFGNLMQPVWEGFASHQWSDAQLDTFQSDFRTLNFLADYLRCIRGERNMSFQTLLWLRDHPAQAKAISDSNSSSGASHSPELIDFVIVPGWIYQNCVSESLYFQEIISAVNPAQSSVDSARVIQASTAIKASGYNPYNILAKLIGAALTKTFSNLTAAQTRANETILAAAIEKYRHAHNSLPSSLNDLQLAGLPTDPVANTPFQYKPTTQDHFTLSFPDWDNSTKVQTW